MPQGSDLQPRCLIPLLPLRVYSAPSRVSSHFQPFPFVPVVLFGFFLRSSQLPVLAVTRPGAMRYFLFSLVSRLCTGLPERFFPSGSLRVYCSFYLHPLDCAVHILVVFRGSAPPAASVLLLYPSQHLHGSGWFSWRNFGAIAVLL